MLDKIIGGFVTILVGASLVTEISRNINYGNCEDRFEDKPQEKHRQTYLEYVQERRAVEKSMKLNLREIFC